jgi:hypothetical protein
MRCGRPGPERTLTADTRSPTSTPLA